MSSIASPARKSAPDLRARNRARNRAELAEIALRLFSERGFNSVTVDDIAAAAGISRRTFFRYFASKEDAVLLIEESALEALRERLAARPPDEPILATIRRATFELLSTALDVEDEATIARLRLAKETPSVAARSLAMRTHWEVAVRNMIAEHLGEHPETSLVATVVATTVIGAVRAATDVWLAEGAEGDLAATIDAAYDLLADGLAVGQ